jgi:chorismate synthase
VGVRATPIAEAMLAIVLMDHFRETVRKMRMSLLHLHQSNLKLVLYKKLTIIFR